MDEQDTKDPEYEDTIETYEKTIGTDKLKIELKYDLIIFTLIKYLSEYKYKKEYKYEEIKNELEIKNCKSIKEIYEYLKKNIIISEENKIKVNKKEIELMEIKLKNEELIKMLIDEIKEIKNNQNKLIISNEEKDKTIKKLKNDYNEIKEKINELEENKKDKDKNKINIIYETKKEGNYNIFGDKFVEINKNNIILNINGDKIDLMNRYKLKEGRNTIKMIIKNKIRNLEEMFYNCNKLKNINDLKYLNTEDCISLEKMFYGCTLLSDIQPLKNWNISNVINFKSMFFGCSSLTNYQILKKWNISNDNYKSMFDINIDNIKYIKDITKDSNAYANIDNTFSLFKSIDDILFLIYSNKNKSIITYNILDNTKTKEKTKAHDEYITNIRHYFDFINKRDLIMSISCDDNNIKIWNFSDWNLLTNITQIYNTGLLCSGCFLKDNYQIYILTSNANINGESEKIKIYNLEGNKINELNNSNIPTFLIDSYYDNKLSKNYIITGNNGFVMSYDYNENKIYHKYIDKDDNSIHINMNINSNDEIIKLIESSFDGYIRIWNFHSGLIINKINVNSGCLYSICLFSNKYLLVGCEDNTIKIIDLEKGIVKKNLTNHNNCVNCVKIIDNSYILSQGVFNDQIKLWKLE